MAGFVPAIHALLLKLTKKDVDARDKRGHDGGEAIRSHRNALQVGVINGWRRLQQPRTIGDATRAEGAMSRLIKIADWSGEKRGNVVFFHGLGAHPFDPLPTPARDPTLSPL